MKLKMLIKNYTISKTSKKKYFKKKKPEINQKFKIESES